MGPVHHQLDLLTAQTEDQHEAMSRETSAHTSEHTICEEDMNDEGDCGLL